jgi:glycosyltransferase involved in cell wall biosynthesis
MKLAIVNNNLKIGGIQKSLINLLNLIGDRYEIDLILFHKDDELLADLNENVNVIESNLLFRLIGISFAEAKKYGFFSRILSFLIKSCARLFGRKFVMSLILPSKSETFGLVYIEAMSQGLPVIYTKGQGIDGLFESQVGYGIDPEDIQGIIEAIGKIYNNYQILSKNAINQAKRLTASNIAKRYIDVWEQR